MVGIAIRRLLAWTLPLVLLVCALPLAAEEWDPDASPVSGHLTPNRRRIARQMQVHDFETRRDPVTGAPDPASADANNDGWPDFWEAIRMVGHPDYLPQ